MTALPPPINGTETYLAAVYDRLGELLDRMPPRPAGLLPSEEPAEAPQTVELREPASPADEGPSGVDTPTGEELKEPAPPVRTGATRKRASTRKGGSS